VFGLGCLFCGLARNLEELVAARAFAGNFPMFYDTFRNIVNFEDVG